MSQLAQVNVARLRAPLGDPSMQDFVQALDRIHRLAEASPGFVWRLTTDDSHGVVVVTEDDRPAFLNLSTWQDYRSLHEFVYRTGHGRFVRDRARWFEPTRQPSTALWWVPAATRPTIGDATRRLRHLREFGPTPRAFSVRRRYTADGAADRPSASRRRPGPRDLG